MESKFNVQPSQDQDQWFTLTGILKYDPFRPGFKKTHKSRTLIVDFARDDFDLYYQWFLKKKFGDWMEIQRPMFGKHVTVVRGDEPGYKSREWGKYEGEKIKVHVSPCLNKNYAFWALPVESDDLLAIRRELGLKNFHNFHMTIGREYEWQTAVTHKRK